MTESGGQGQSRPVEFGPPYSEGFLAHLHAGSYPHDPRLLSCVYADPDAAAFLGRLEHVADTLRRLGHGEELAGVPAPPPTAWPSYEAYLDDEDVQAEYASGCEVPSICGPKGE